MKKTFLILLLMLGVSVLVAAVCLTVYYIGAMDNLEHTIHNAGNKDNVSIGGGDSVPEDTQTPAVNVGSGVDNTEIVFPLQDREKVYLVENKWLLDSECMSIPALPLGTMCYYEIPEYEISGHFLVPHWESPTTSDSVSSEHLIYFPMASELNVSPGLMLKPDCGIFEAQVSVYYYSSGEIFNSYINDAGETMFVCTDTSVNYLVLKNKDYSGFVWESSDTMNYVSNFATISEQTICFNYYYEYCASSSVNFCGTVDWKGIDGIKYGFFYLTEGSEEFVLVKPDDAFLKIRYHGEVTGGWVDAPVLVDSMSFSRYNRTFEISVDWGYTAPQKFALYCFACYEESLEVAQ